MDHHILTFHRSGDVSSPDEDIQNNIETKPRDTEENNCDERIMVKEELLPEAADEEEEINVDEQVEENEQKEDKQLEFETKLKTEIEEENILQSSISEKMES